MYKAFCDVCGNEILENEEKICKLDIVNRNELEKEGNYSISMMCSECKAKILDAIVTKRSEILK